MTAIRQQKYITEYKIFKFGVKFRSRMYKQNQYMKQAIEA
jgi:hypothetical protein